MAREVQTILFAKNESPSDVNNGEGWTAAAAKGWLDSHDKRSDKIDETENTFRFRQFEPSQCRVGSYKSMTENMPKGIVMTSCERIESDSVAWDKIPDMIQNMDKSYRPEVTAAAFHNAIERRFTEFRDEPLTGRKLVGYASVYYDGTPKTESKSFFGTVERIMPGTFDRAIREDDVRALFNHDDNNILGRTSAGTLRLSSDIIGLRYEIDLPDSPIGQTVKSAIERRDVTGSSFSFVVFQEEWLEKNKVREIREVELFDVGPVTFPAYEATQVSARALEHKNVMSAREETKTQHAVIGYRLRVLDLGQQRTLS